MRIERTLAAVVVSVALVLPVGATAAPAVAAPAPVTSSVQDSGAATYAREFVFFLVCLLKGQLAGSKFPLC
ncbi:hypothetical protein DFR70_101336 [Nocardia tenerifensis]|uniref:Secreted protein n=1 Tax=Nocardia tenerifensis TaxID=228006 RepID=A0A318KDF0_9NOCA|nr:hypothetical protein [Nocardia tenerifensis]PXX70915.1 hypothetical protein DFR70_101336 [Nocardia tenerifensis]